MFSSLFKETRDEFAHLVVGRYCCYSDAGGGVVVWWCLPRIFFSSHSRRNKVKHVGMVWTPQRDGDRESSESFRRIFFEKASPAQPHVSFVYSFYNLSSYA